MRALHHAGERRVEGEEVEAGAEVGALHALGEQLPVVLPEDVTDLAPDVLAEAFAVGTPLLRYLASV